MLIISTNTPKLNKGRNKQTFGALNANMRQTNSQIILQQALNERARINLCQIKVNGQPIDNINAINTQIIVQDELEVGFGDEFYATVLDEFYEGEEEELAAGGVLLVVGQLL
jgi:hypothetical protein